MDTVICLPLVLKQNWTRIVLMLPGIVILGGLGGILSYMGFARNEMAAFGIGVCFNLMALLGVLSFFRCRLMLTEQGFEFKGPLRPLFVRWEDVQHFVPTRVSLGWNYTPEFRKITKWRKFNRETGTEASIPNQFGGMSALKFAQLMNKLRYRYQSAPEISAERKFALATSAILTEMNGHRHDCLYGDRNSPALEADACQVLKDYWGVHNGVQITERLHLLKEEGQCAEYEYIRDRLNEAGTIADPLELLDKEIVAKMSKAERKDFQRKITFVQKHSKTHRTLLAWDLCRLVSVARLGAAAGHLTDSDAWAWIETATQELQETYGSWSELAENYTLGREFWGSTHGKAEFSEAVNALLNKDNPDSPWNKILWSSTYRV